MTNSSLPKSGGVGQALVILDIRPGSQLLLPKVNEHQNQGLPKVNRSQNLTSLLAAIILIMQSVDNPEITSNCLSFHSLVVPELAL